jgi:hypothetical protein
MVMPPLIRVPFDAFKEVEKLLKYKFWDKERERSNRAAGMADLAQGTRRRCPLRHSRIAWSGPPHDPVRTYVCLDCNAAACEPEIKDRGFEFETIPDWEIDTIFDLDLHRQAEGNPKTFGGLGGKR